MFEWWYEFLYNISHAINQCLDALFKLFLFFAGASDADINMEFTGSTSANPLQTIFATNNVAIWFAGVLGLAIFVFMISIIIAMVRTEITGKDNREGKIKIFKSCIKGTLLIVLLPAIFGIALRAVTILLNGISTAMSTDGNNSFAQELFNICIPDQTSGNTYPWDSTYSQLSAWLGENGSMHDYNFFIAYVGGIIMLFILGLSVLNLIERIIDLVFLYIISPVVIAVSPLDEGNRLGIWKDLTIAKFLSIAGMLMCFYIYFLFMSIINSLLTERTFLVGFAKLICSIGGALAARKGGLLISNLVGHNTALIEGQQQGLAAQAVGTGFRAGLGVIGALGHGAIHLLGWGGKKIGGAISGGKAASVASTAVETGAAAVVGVAGAAANTAQNTFQTVAEAFNHQNGGQAPAVPNTMPTAPSAMNGIAAPPNSAPAPATGNNGTSEGQRLAQPPVMPNGTGAPEISVSNGTPAMMPPVSGDIQNIINSADGFNGAGGAGNENK